MTSCTASFQETSAKVGDRIHADFTWSDAQKHPTYLFYATMSIISPSGAYKTTFIEFGNHSGSKTLDYVADEVGTWKCEIKVWQGVFWVTCNDTVGVSVTTCTADFRETSATVGDTIHADFTWSDAQKHPTYLFYATMSIIKPSGVYAKTFIEFVNHSGSKTLDYVADEVGTWKCEIKVWQGVFWVTCTGELGVSSGVAILQTALTCRWVEGWRDHGPMVTTFQLGDEVHVYLEWGPTTHDFYGETIGFKWYHRGVKVWEQDYLITEHWYGVWWHLWWAINVGTGYIEAYWQGEYLGKTNDYSVVGTGPGVIGTIDFSNSTFYTGPFYQGKVEKVCHVTLKNTGWDGGTLYYKVCEYPGESGEKQIDYAEFDANPGQSFIRNTNDTIPAPPTLPLGVKVWGESESEPPWGSMGTKMFKILRS